MCEEDYNFNNPPTAQIFLVHDFLEHSMKWRPLLQEYFDLNQNTPSGISQGKSLGYDFYLMDLRGHGLSTGPRSHIDDFSIFCKDLASLINVTRDNRQHNTKVFLIAQGMGALVVLKAIEQYRHLIDAKLGGLILLNPSFKVNLSLPFEVSFDSKFVSPILEKLRLKRSFGGHDIYQYLEDAEDYNADPLIPNDYSYKLIREFLNTAKEIRQFSYFVDAPSLFLTGNNNILFDQTSAQLFQKGIPSHNSSYLRYDTPKHNLLYSNFNNDILSSIRKWLEQHVSET